MHQQQLRHHRSKDEGLEDTETESTQNEAKTGKSLKKRSRASTSNQQKNMARPKAGREEGRKTLKK